MFKKLWICPNGSLWTRKKERAMNQALLAEIQERIVASEGDAVGCLPLLVILAYAQTRARRVMSIPARAIPSFLNLVSPLLVSEVSAALRDLQESVVRVLEDRASGRESTAESIQSITGNFERARALILPSS
mmetsp:Transcript_10985/g.21909  ORF Transcript_10985/g.21909 Transcript_10985/m.21909 type:complete len:132 (+) Transcript_10985:1930-2325(+)